MKKNCAMRLAALMLVLVMMTSCFVGGTFAKYTSDADVKATASVAKWSIDVEGTEIANATKQTVNVDLFTTLYEEDGQNTETDVAGTSLIAPGTGGSFDLDVKNLSEVNAKYDIAFTIENTSSIPLEFSTDGGTTWSFAIADVNVSGKEINMGATDATTTTVMWRWAFNDVPNYKSDATDTALGIAAQTAAPTVTVTATITAYQVD